jgi:hypothetical protein
LIATYNYFWKIVDAEFVAKVYWTGSTKSGCVGQYSDCFEGAEKSHSDSFDVNILTNEHGGSCVGVAMLADGLVAKAMYCEKKIFLACQSRKDTWNLGENVRKSLNVAFDFITH